MIEEQEIGQIKERIEQFLQNMTLTGFNVQASVGLSSDSNGKDVVDVVVTMEDPQMLIGQGGQTLFELTRLLRIMLNKKLAKDFYVNVDINDYKKKKVEYLESLAASYADQVAADKQEKVLQPMPSYERRIIHAALSKRQDVATESQGEGAERYIVIKPK